MIENAVRQFILDELNHRSSNGDLSDDYPLLERNVLDSLGLFQLVGFLESEFGVEIADEELLPANFGTIHDIGRLIREKTP